MRHLGIDYAEGASVRVSGLLDVVGIAAGEFHSCAVTSDGKVYCWGSDWYGQLGDGQVELKSWTV